MPRLYKNLFRPLIFRNDPELMHERVSGWLKWANGLGLSPLLRALFGTGQTSIRLLQEVDGLRFVHPVGLAAGFDKSSDLYAPLSGMGFSFIECGTFTAISQEGNPRPRIFRIPERQAILNRMGFNNPGAEQAAITLQKASRSGALRGINIGKSKVVELEDAVEDYRTSARILAPYADYMAINVSSPNTPGLRQLQKTEFLENIMRSVREEVEFVSKNRADHQGQSHRKQAAGEKIPLFVKIAPDMEEDLFDAILESIDRLDFTGIILTNTTIDKSSLPDRFHHEEGGVSGAPVRNVSTELIARAYRFYRGRRVIIGVGGVFGPEDAIEKIRAGANLVQLYTGYIYEGPGLPGRIVRALGEYLEQRNSVIQEIIGLDADRL